MGDTNWVKNFKPQVDGDAEWAEGMRYLFDDANEKIGDMQKAIECFMNGAQLGNENCMRGLLPVKNPVAASRRICPKPASGEQRQWDWTCMLRSCRNDSTNGIGPFGIKKILFLLLLWNGLVVVAMLYAALSIDRSRFSTSRWGRSSSFPGHRRFRHRRGGKCDIILIDKKLACQRENQYEVFRHRRKIVALRACVIFVVLPRL